MPTVNTVQYKYGYNSQNSVVDVETLERENGVLNEKYFCIACGRELVAALGPKNRKHFRHREEWDCSRETYLHKLAKSVFREVYQSCLDNNRPFIIILHQEKVCSYCTDELGFICKESEPGEHDLTRWFNKVNLEQKTDSFIPDLLLLSDKGERLFIEIAVTHFSSEQKKASGNRVIEISIQSEDDIAIIRSCKLSSEQPIHFYNFRVVTKAVDLHSNCPTKHPYFVILSNQKSLIILENVITMKRRVTSGEFLYWKLVNDSGPNTFYSELKAAYQKNIKVKNCFLCRYHGENYSWDDDGQPIFCKLFKHKHNSNRAVACEAYRADPKVFP